MLVRELDQGRTLMFNYAGRSALITGAGQGVGAATARILASRGATIAVNDLDAGRAAAVVKEINDSGGRAVAAIADVTSETAVRSMVAETVSTLGRIDILVNNAGVPPEGTLLKRFADSTASDWQMPINLNFFGVLYCVHAVLPGMIDAGWGRIITIVSEAGRIGEQTVAVYAGAKAAAAGFSRSLAKEVGRHGITCNSISLASMFSEKDYPDPDKLARITKTYLAGRLGKPTDVAAAVTWLASSEAEWVTGQTIPVNGGYATS